MFYIYAYVRQDGTPYYIGKGCGNRAWNKNKKDIIKPPVYSNHIVIMESNLTELGALALERFYIRWYGRKDNKTGILRNKTDGGEGTSGAKHPYLKRRPPSEETKRKISEAKRKNPIIEKTKKKWLITYIPTGQTWIVDNMKKFSIERGINNKNLHKTTKGIRNQCAGYKANLL